ncbi:MAG: hypothetical protein WBP29_11485 [Candidatus Zixiibacteriota bacterium]
MPTATPRRKNDSALNIFITSELKAALNQAARQYGVNVADLVRISVRAMLPVLAAMASAQEIIVNELIGHLGGSMRKRHDTLDPIEIDYDSKQGRGPC